MKIAVQGIIGLVKSSINRPLSFVTMQVLSGFGMRAWWNQQPLQKQKEVMATMLQWLADGLISIPAGRSFSLEQAAEAVMLTTQSGRGPKPILLPG